MTNPRIEDDAHSAIDPAPGRPPVGAGAGARSADAWLRTIAGAAAFALAAQSSAGTALVLGLAGAIAWTGAAPRATALALALAGTSIAASNTGMGGVALVLIAACAVRLRLQLGAAGPWLRDVRRLESQRARALMAAGLARSRGDAGALASAGDRLEREGVARRRLDAIGAAPSRALGGLLPASQRVGAWLRRTPGLRDALERAVAEPGPR